MELLIDNRYLCKLKIGSGGMGSVYLATDLKLNKKWAVKACDNMSANEIEILKKIDHRAFPRIVDVVEQDSVTYIVMDYIEGITLSEYLKENKLNEKQVVDITIEIAQALSYLHGLTPSLIYMDCKPSNIMLTESGEIRLVDLGSVYICGLTDPQRISCTAFYAPGEILRPDCEGNLDPSIDIYGLGMTMYYMLTGNRVEYRDKRGYLDLKRCNRHISHLLEKIIIKCTLPYRDRYHSMEDLINDLKKVNSGKPVNLTRISIPSHFRFSGVMDVLCKLILALSILLWAYFREYMDSPLWSVVFALMLLVFWLLCRKKHFYSVEIKKSLIRAEGSRFLILIVVSLLALGGLTLRAYADRYSEPLKVNFYDEFGRTSLTAEGYVRPVKGDIHLSIPVSQLEEGVNVISISCESQNSLKKYTLKLQSSSAPDTDYEE